MRELEHRQRVRRRIYSLPALAVLALAAIFLTRGAYSLMMTERESRRDAELLVSKVEELRAREDVLLREIDKLTTEAGIEEEIKSKFNVARAGEHVAIIVDRPESEASSTPQKVSWWKSFLDAIIGR